MNLFFAAVSVLLNAVACFSAGVSAFLADKSGFGIPQDTEIQGAKKTSNPCDDVNANYKEHR